MIKGKGYEIVLASYDPAIDNCHEKTIARFKILSLAEKCLHKMSGHYPVYLWDNRFPRIGNSAIVCWSLLYNNEYSKIHD